MSARDWQPGDEFVVRVSLDDADDVPVPEGHRWVTVAGTVNSIAVPERLLLPVPEPDEALREYERAVVQRILANIPDREGDRTPDWLSLVSTAMIDARPLLASPVQPGRSEAEERVARVEELLAAAYGSPEFGLLHNGCRYVEAAYVHKALAARVADTTDTEGGE